jgi:hypothetical protein
MKTRNTVFTTARLALGFLALGCLVLPNRAQAVSPAPDGGYRNGNTAEGQSALLSLTNGGYNTGNGWNSLHTLSGGSFNTGIGAATLFSNTADENTATGAAALFSNTTGGYNTANGAFALLHNTTGGANTAIGHEALFSNTEGYDNRVSQGAQDRAGVKVHCSKAGGDYCSAKADFRVKTGGTGKANRSANIGLSEGERAT